MTSKADLSEEVVAAVSEAEGIDPTNLEASLFEAVDGDALDRLFQDASGHVTFEYGAYEVTVTSEGDVSVEPLSE